MATKKRSPPPLTRGPTIYDIRRRNMLWLIEHYCRTDSGRPNKAEFARRIGWDIGSRVSSYTGSVPRNISTSLARRIEQAFAEVPGMYEGWMDTAHDERGLVDAVAAMLRAMPAHQRMAWMARLMQEADQAAGSD